MLMHGGLICITFCPSVCLSVTGPKLRRLENNSYFNKQSSWHVSRLDISCDGSKSACLCHGKCNNVAHEKSRSTTGVIVYIEIPKAFHVVSAICESPNR